MRPAPGNWNVGVPAPSSLVNLGPTQTMGEPKFAAYFQPEALPSLRLEHYQCGSLPAVWPTASSWTGTILWEQSMR